MNRSWFKASDFYNNKGGPYRNRKCTGAMKRDDFFVFDFDIEGADQRFV